MSDTDPDMVDPDTPPADPEPGPHREMVALSITKGPRDIARYVKTRPEYSGNPEDWVCFAYLLASFFEQVKLQATATGNDPRKTSDVEEHVEAWEDDNKFVFELLMSMISTKTTAGKTLIKQVIKKFPLEGEKQGDELFKFMEEKATGLTKMQIKQLKEDIKKVELLESDSPKTWETKLTDLGMLWTTIPEHLRGGDEETLSDIMLDKVPEALEHYATIVTGMASFDSEYLKDSETVMNKLVDLHRKVKGSSSTKKRDGGRAYVAGREPRDQPGTSKHKRVQICR